MKWSVIARNAMWEYASKVQILYSILEKKSKLTSDDLQYVMDMLFSRISIYPHEEYADCYPLAEEIMKDIDPDDTPFLAFAMKTKVDGIRSEDKGFQKQDCVKVYRTGELV